MVSSRCPAFLWVVILAGGAVPPARPAQRHGGPDATRRPGRGKTFSPAQKASAGEAGTTRASARQGKDLCPDGVVAAGLRPKASGCAMLAGREPAAHAAAPSDVDRDLDYPLTR